MKGTELENVKKIRLFFMVVIAWVSNGITTTLMGQTKIDHRTLAEYRARLQNVVNGTLRNLAQADELMLGGDRVVVEVDECKLYSSKTIVGLRKLGTCSGWSELSNATDKMEGGRLLW